MSLFASKIKVIILLMILVSILDTFDDYLLTYFGYKDDGSLEQLFDTGLSIVEFFLIYQVLLKARKIIHQLNEKENRYQRLVEFSAEPIFIHNGEEIIYSNHAFVTAMAASNVKELLGRSVMDIVHPQFHEVVAKRKQQVEMYGELAPIEYKIIRLDGEVRDFEMSTIAVMDNTQQVFQVFGKDITDRKKAEEELKRTKEQLENIMDSVDVAIWAMGLQDDIIFVSQGIEKISGYKPSEYYDQPMLQREIVIPEDRHIPEQIYQDALLGLSSKREYRILDRSGKMRWFYKCGYPIFDDKGNIIQINGVTIDITKRKEAEIAVKNSEQLHQLLQTSLEHFSRDVFDMMKVSEMEEHLIKVMEDVIHHSSVGILEAAQDIKLKKGNCNVSQETLSSSLDSETGIGELIVISQGTLIKMGERNQTTIWLWIGNRPDLITIFPKKVWLETITRYVSVWYENLYRIEDLTKELEQLAHVKQAPTWLLRLLFQISERERIRLAIDLHDSALQEQIIWYRKMEPYCVEASIPAGIREELEQIRQGMKNVMEQIRATCNQLRPPFIKRLGLFNSLKGLTRDIGARSDYEVYFHASQFQAVLNDEQELGIYRIVQELLNNATKHSQATRVDIALLSDTEKVEIRYEDNGIGFGDVTKVSHHNHMGLFGIKERVRSLEGDIKFSSTKGEGLQVFVTIPVRSSDSMPIIS
ncbi:hypothetical protein COJ96_02340 [Bacillus sp. AFS073361]|uniref:PAS domain-containing sensor histidine kinase n=1 Tax=Bacillus sp. AFS073361 TaxID=2033511 RepID=UPI000BF34F6A|nr:PAS domain S-box protein [Bacillus sp. AFS073361]PFP30823.1 hypothetical protein COJ96_02340 [Bacillus sp. AFS073361]